MTRRALVLAVCLVAGCTNAGLQPPDESENNLVDDKLAISGEVCTSVPSEQVFPVKIMFIVDTSGSMQFTDPSSHPDVYPECIGECEAYNRGEYHLDKDGFPVPPAEPVDCPSLCEGADNPGRMAAVQEVIDRFKNNPAVSFSVITFNGVVKVNGEDVDDFGDGFLDGHDARIVDARESLMEADITTDYQGALSTAYRVLEKDMLRAGAVERARTKYVLLFLSDGGPNPLCHEGCDDTDDFGLPSNQRDSWCDVPRDDWCNYYQYDDEMCSKMEDAYPAMAEPCRAYNSERQIETKVKEILALQEHYGAGEIRLHTAFLFVNNLPRGILDLFYPLPEDWQTRYPGMSATEAMKYDAQGLLQKMASWGDGLFRGFNAGAEIDFLDINYAAVQRPFGITNLIVSNRNTLPDVNKIQVDSDGDGVDDVTEFENQMDDTSPDSDDDGYSDRLEYLLRDAGFDPTDPALPVRACRKQGDIDGDGVFDSYLDRDGDGLTDCEEKVLGTDAKQADTDRDRIPDGIEFHFGTDPLRDDSETDADFDGKRAGEEISIHASPLVTDPDVHADFKYIYEVKEQPENPDRTRCYAFDVRNVRLRTTKARAGAGTLGYNEIIVVFGEGPADDPQDYGNFKAACVRAQYVEPSYKFPASGRVVLSDSDFYPLSSDDSARPSLKQMLDDHALDPVNNPDPCVGAELP